MWKGPPAEKTVREEGLMKQGKHNGIVFKWGLYIISLRILLFMLIVLKADVSKIHWAMTGAEWGGVFADNLFSCVCTGILALGLAGSVYFRDVLKSAKKLPVEIEECECINYENLSFLATYVIPLVCFPTDTHREMFVLFSFILIIGCIFVKTNMYYTNPSLVLLGYNIYSIHCKNSLGFGKGIVIVRGRLEKGDSIAYLELSDKVYFARRVQQCIQKN